jgi:hypothetical protein
MMEQALYHWRVRSVSDSETELWQAADDMKERLLGKKLTVAQALKHRFFKQPADASTQALLRSNLPLQSWKPPAQAARQANKSAGASPLSAQQSSSSR